MRDAHKKPLVGLCPRPQDFRRNISGVRGPAMKTAPDNYHRQRPDASSAHRRPGYPLSGCVPAAPDSVLPGNHTVAARSIVRKYASAPELCLKNPNRFQKASKSVQKLSEESKFTHSLCRRPFLNDLLSAWEIGRNAPAGAFCGKAGKRFYKDCGFEVSIPNIFRNSCSRLFLTAGISLSNACNASIETSVRFFMVSGCWVSIEA